MNDNVKAEIDQQHGKTAKDARVSISASITKEAYDKLVDKRWARRDNTIAETIRAAIAAFVE